MKQLNNTVLREKRSLYQKMGRLKLFPQKKLQLWRISSSKEKILVHEKLIEQRQSISFLPFPTPRQVQLETEYEDQDNDSCSSLIIAIAKPGLKTNLNPLPWL